MNRQFFKTNKNIQSKLAPGETAQANKVLLIDGPDFQGAGYIKQLDPNENLFDTQQVKGYHSNTTKFAEIVPPGFSFSGVSRTFEENGSGKFSKRRGFIVPKGNVYGNPPGVKLYQPFPVQKLIDHPSGPIKTLRLPGLTAEIAAKIAYEEQLQQARRAFENIGYQPELQTSVTAHTGTQTRDSIPEPRPTVYTGSELPTRHQIEDNTSVISRSRSNPERIRTSSIGSISSIPTPSSSDSSRTRELRATSQQNFDEGNHFNSPHVDYSVALGEHSANNRLNITRPTGNYISLKKGTKEHFNKTRVRSH